MELKEIERRLPASWQTLVGGGLLVAAIASAGIALSRKRSPEQGIEVEKAITILKPAGELFAFWRQFQNLPRFTKHLVSVSVRGPITHWVARAPIGQTVEWDAQVVDEDFGHHIHWRSLPGASIPNEGAVEFEELSNGRGTVVRVALRYDPPGGEAAALLSKLFGEEPSLQVAEDLRRFRQLMEAGEVLETEGQPHGKR